MAETTVISDYQPVDVPETPWTQRALELAATEGYYADYAAWQEWFDARLDGEFGGAVDTINASKMYAACCSLFDAGVAAGRSLHAAKEPTNHG